MQTLQTRDSINLKSYRINSIDVLRGLVMIIMALDHTRDFLHKGAYTDSPLNLETTTPILFFTRWITHFCAPVFIFLTGTSAFLQSLRKTKKELSSFLIKRGLWLILLELVFMSFTFTYDISFSLITLSILWAIGVSMVVLGIIIWLPFNFILFLGLIIVLGHNSFDFYEANHVGPFPVWYRFLHVPGIIPLSKGYALGNFYPVLSWIGFMMLGYCFGKFYTSYQDAKKRNQMIALIGAILVLFFIVLRWMNVYGDPVKWATQRNGLYTFLSFLNTAKYPPSLLFLCMTIGPALLFLAAVGNIRNRVTKVISVYGQVPLFYFLLHFFILRLLSAILFLQRGHTFSEGVKGLPGFPFKFMVPGEGVSLGMVYIIWAALVILLYPLCKWYSHYKREHKNWLVSYL